MFGGQTRPEAILRSQIISVPLTAHVLEGSGPEGWAKGVLGNANPAAPAAHNLNNYCGTGKMVPFVKILLNGEWLLQHFCPF